MAHQPTIPKGTRDFSPAVMVRRNFIFDTVKSVFQLYGYLPIETPAMENLSTLMGKYGEEGDKLLFKILNSGDFLSKIKEPRQYIEREMLNNILPGIVEGIKKIVSNYEKYDKTEQFQQVKEYLALLQYGDIIYFLEEHFGWFSNTITEKGLRYDLTVPFARYVVQNRNDIVFPFKRYQIQPVWRADKPQKGRYREFFQCDVDVIGSNSLMNEAELVLIMNGVFKKLGIKNTIKLNNRKVLYGIAEYLGETGKFVSFTVAIDKIDKIGIQKVKEELSLSGFTATSIDILNEILSFTGNSVEKIEFLSKILSQTETGSKGMTEVSSVFELLKGLELSSDVEFDLTLARGLNYYTGAIFEVEATDVTIGSICGGGRYDDLTGIFGLPGISGIGVSFGADRIYDVMMELGLFPDQTTNSTQVLFVNFGEKEQKYCLQLVNKLRQSGINTELYPDTSKIKKQMSYADSRKIPFVALVGENEMKENILTVKNMISGEQSRMTIEDLILKINTFTR
jgi:histidyl-tRNA synthetase